MTVSILVPITSSQLYQYTDVQRGTIFLFMLTSIIMFIVVMIRIVSNRLDPDDGSQYEDKPQNKKGANESEQVFDRAVIKTQTVEEEDTGTVIFVKRMMQFNTVYHPFFVMFALNLVTGTTYAFDMVLYFFVLLPLVLFNLVKLHRRCIDHKVFIVLLENLWVVLSFFWLLNVWATTRYIQPYYKN